MYLSFTFRIDDTTYNRIGSQTRSVKLIITSINGAIHRQIILLYKKFKYIMEWMATTRHFNHFFKTYLYIVSKKQTIRSQRFIGYRSGMGVENVHESCRQVSSSFFNLPINTDRCGEYWFVGISFLFRRVDSFFH